MSAVAALAAVLQPAPTVPAFRKIGQDRDRGSRWEPAFLDAIHGMRSRKLSFGAIAQQIGVTRNSVIGAVNRARAGSDKRFPYGEVRNAITAKAPPGQNAKRKSRARPDAAVVRFPTRDRRVADLPLFSPTARVNAMAPASLLRTVLTVQPMECRYIAGSDRLMCGHAVEGAGSWCPYHRPLTLARAA